MAPRGTYPSEMADTFAVRMPEGMRERLKRMAADNNRSMNSEVVARLEASFSAPVALAPEIAHLIDQHITGEVQRRLRDIAAKIGGAE